jgi:hypothetical protein
LSQRGLSTFKLDFAIDFKREVSLNDGNKKMNPERPFQMFQMSRKFYDEEKSVQS